MQGDEAVLRPRLLLTSKMIVGGGVEDCVRLRVKAIHRAPTVHRRKIDARELHF